MIKDHEQLLRQHLLELLEGGGAHAKFEDVIKDLPAKLRGLKPAKFPHTAWMLLEHLRLAEADILGVRRNGTFWSSVGMRSMFLPSGRLVIGRRRKARRMRRRGRRASGSFAAI